MPGDTSNMATADIIARMWADDEFTRRTLERNKDKNFVRRILDPSSYPAITNDRRLKPGDRATHQMSWTTVESGPLKGSNIVYPNIVHDQRSNQLQWLGPREAAQYAEQTGQFIKFNTPEQADMFSKYYKRGAGL